MVGMPRTAPGDQPSTSVAERQPAVRLQPPTHSRSRLFDQRTIDQAGWIDHARACTVADCSESCRMQKDALDHVETCNRAFCAHFYCIETRTVLEHWRRCTLKKTCKICLPNKNRARENQRRLHQAEWIVHARSCIIPACSESCRLQKEALIHVESCKKEPASACQFNFCSETRAVLSHWTACSSRSTCKLCAPYQKSRHWTDQNAADQAEWIVHARSCVVSACTESCKSQKEALMHLEKCLNGDCTYKFCRETRDVLEHWNRCPVRDTCQVCQPYSRDGTDQRALAQAEWIVHAKMCKVPVCFDSCKMQKDAIAHVESEVCSKNGCDFHYCKETRAILDHWLGCDNHDNCRICLPYQNRSREDRRQINQAGWIVHAKECIGCTGTSNLACSLQKEALSHVEQCGKKGDESCAFDLCKETRDILNHWKVCVTKDSCQICEHLVIPTPPVVPLGLSPTVKPSPPTAITTEVSSKKKKKKKDKKKLQDQQLAQAAAALASAAYAVFSDINAENGAASSTSKDGDHWSHFDKHVKNANFPALAPSSSRDPIADCQPSTSAAATATAAGAARKPVKMDGMLKKLEEYMNKLNLIAAETKEESERSRSGSESTAHSSPQPTASHKAAGATQDVRVAYDAASNRNPDCLVQHTRWMIHSTECEKAVCEYSECLEVKRLFEHMLKCNLRDDCTRVRCWSTRKLIRHFADCSLKCQCNICRVYRIIGGKPEDFIPLDKVLIKEVGKYSLAAQLMDICNVLHQLPIPEDELKGHKMFNFYCRSRHEREDDGDLSSNSDIAALLYPTMLPVLPEGSSMCQQPGLLIAKVEKGERREDVLTFVNISCAIYTTSDSFQTGKIGEEMAVQQFTKHAQMHRLLKDAIRRGNKDAAHSIGVEYAKFAACSVVQTLDKKTGERLHTLAQQNLSNKP